MLVAPGEIFYCNPLIIELVDAWDCVKVSMIGYTSPLRNVKGKVEILAENTT